MVFNQIPDTYIKLNKHESDFEITDHRVIERDNEGEFIIRVKIKGNMDNALGMVMKKLDGINGEWYTTPHKSDCFI